MSNETNSRLTILQIAQKVLEHIPYPLTSMGIYEHAKDKGYNVGGKTPWQSIGARIYVDIRDNKDSPFMFASKNPRTFWLKSRANELEGKSQEYIEDLLEKDEINREEKVTGHRTYTEFKEADLHPLLVAFLDANENFRLHCKTIIHNKCAKRAKGETEWNHPDIVGVHFPFDDDLCKDTLAFLKNSNLLDYKIYSFEIKNSISSADVKKYYFQAVSNSSFAHFGYLVVYVNIDDDVLKELRRLNNLFGIGVIQLESNVFDSTILLPARENKLDIATLDMLTTSCPCFKEFIQDINDYIKAKSQNLHAKTHFDKVLNDEEMQQHITDKKMSK